MPDVVMGDVCIPISLCFFKKKGRNLSLPLSFCDQSIFLFYFSLFHFFNFIFYFADLFKQSSENCMGDANIPSVNGCYCIIQARNNDSMLNSTEPQNVTQNITAFSLSWLLCCQGNELLNGGFLNSRKMQQRHQ